MDNNRRSRSYYRVLGVIRDSASEIRTAYRKFALKWHPDKCILTPPHAEESKTRFQQIQEAYTVSSDQRKKMMYDVGLYDPDEEGDEMSRISHTKVFSEFMQEMLSLMATEKRKEKSYSIAELQRMLAEMQKEYYSHARWTVEEDYRSSKRGSVRSATSTCQGLRCSNAAC